jgi:hypothetical protein
MVITINYPSTLTATQVAFISNNISKLKTLLTTITNEENIYGTSPSQKDLIRAFALLYYNIIQVVELQFNAGWVLTNWLTQAEINKINFLKTLEGYV